MVTSGDIEQGEANKAVVQGWIDHWTPVAVDVARAMAGVYDLPPLPVGTFENALQVASATQAELVEALGLSAKGLVK